MQNWLHRQGPLDTMTMKAVAVAHLMKVVGIGNINLITDMCCPTCAAKLHMYHQPQWSNSLNHLVVKSGAEGSIPTCADTVIRDD